MPQDVLIRSFGEFNGLYDLVIENGDFKSAEGFETAIPVALHTDIRASESEVQESKNRRGWVGNILTYTENYQLGSKLWLFDQSRLTTETENRAKTEVQLAFQRMLSDGVLSSLEVQLDTVDNRTTQIHLNFNSIDNVIDRYVTLWRRTDATQLPTI